MGTTTPNFNLYKPAIGETGWGALVDTNFDTIDANLVNGLPRAYLAGLKTSLSGGSPSTIVAVTAGDAQDAGNAGAIRLVAALSKNINATWLVGSGNGGLATALVYTANTTYHLFLIKRTDTGVVDAYFDTSTSAANIPAPYTLFRRISSHIANVSKLLIPWVQDGDRFMWQSVPTTGLDLNSTNPGTNAGTVTFLVPIGINVQAIFHVQGIRGTGVDPMCYFSDFDTADLAPGTTAPPLSNFSLDGAAATALTCGMLTVRTNLAAQIRFRLNASAADTILRACAVGYNDSRGSNG